MRRVATAVLATLALLALLIALPVPGAAQEQADEGERSVDLASPGVVFITTSANVKVRLTYSDPTRLSGLGQLNQKVWVDYSSGSGFVVNPGGSIVTASHVVEPAERDMRNYATNMLVLAGLGYGYDDPFIRYRITDDPWLNRLLQQCYRGVACEFTINPKVFVYTPVEIAGQQYPVGVPARILTSTGFKATDVAVIQVEGDNMPTVALAETTDVAGGDELTALGFPGSVIELPTGVTEPTKIFGRVSNVRAVGTSTEVEVDMDIEPGMSGGPVIDANGEVIGLTSYRRIQSTGEAGVGYLRTVDDIRLAMSDAGVTAERGMTDEAYAKGMEYFYADHYTAAVDQFTKTLAFYEGHPLAKQYLADAQAEAGGPNDVPLPVEEPEAAAAAAEDEEGSSVMLYVGIGAAVVLLLGLAVLLTRRRRAPAREAPVATNAAPAPSPAVEATPTAAVVEPPPVVEPAPQPVAAESTTPVPAATFPKSSVVDMETGEETHFCGHCGHKVEPDDLFCEHCGHQLHAA